MYRFYLITDLTLVTLTYYSAIPIPANFLLFSAYDWLPAILCNLLQYLVSNDKVTPLKFRSSRYLYGYRVVVSQEVEYNSR